MVGTGSHFSSIQEGQRMGLCGLRLVILSRTKQGGLFAIVIVYRYAIMERNKL
jgi:hypothetical protein